VSAVLSATRYTHVSIEDAPAKDGSERQSWNMIS